MTKYITHPYGFKYPIIPFIWNYNDFSNPIKTFEIIKLSKSEFSDKIPISINRSYYQEIELLNDTNTDYYIHLQYREEPYLYEGDITDLYVGFHTWAYYLDNKCNTIDNTVDVKYEIKTGIFPITGNLMHSNLYNKKNGIDINSTSTRKMSIHSVDDIPRFSSENVCNFYTEDENIKFISIGKNLCKINKKNKTNICKNVVTLHILRNKPDYNIEFIRHLFF